MAFDKSNPLTIGLIALFVVAVVAALFGGGVVGKATYFVEEFQGYEDELFAKGLAFPVYAEYREGWGECVGQDGDWVSIDNLCKSIGHSGAAPSDARPCLHEWRAERWHWDGTVPMLKGELDPSTGYALTAVKCV